MQKQKKDGRGGPRPGAGRKPKADEARIRDLVSPYIPDAIETVVNILKTADKDSDRLSAARLLIEYGYGKPQQYVDHSNKGEKFESVDYTRLSDATLREIAAAKKEE